MNTIFNLKRFAHWIWSSIELAVPHLTAVLSILALLYVVVMHYGDFDRSLMLGAALLNVVATAMAAIASIRIAHLEMSVYIPSVRVLIDFHSVPGLMTLKIRNAGRSPAHHISLDFSKSTEVIRELIAKAGVPTSIVSLFPDESELLFSLAATSDQRVWRERPRLTVQVQYRDSLGRLYEEVVTQDLAKYHGTLLWGSIEARTLNAVNDVERSLKNMERSLKNMECSLKKLAKKAGGSRERTSTDTTG